MVEEMAGAAARGDVLKACASRHVMFRLSAFDSVIHRADVGIQNNTPILGSMWVAISRLFSFFLFWSSYFLFVFNLGLKFGYFSIIIVLKSGLL